MSWTVSWSLVDRTDTPPPGCLIIASRKPFFHFCSCLSQQGFRKGLSAPLFPREPPHSESWVRPRSKPLSSLLCISIYPSRKILFLPGHKGEGGILEEVWIGIFLSLAWRDVRGVFEPLHCTFLLFLIGGPPRALQPPFWPKDEFKSQTAELVLAAFRAPVPTVLPRPQCSAALLPL